MSKYHGMIGFGVTEEVRPGVWKPVITERQYFGDVVALSRRFQNGEGANDNIEISNEIQIIADPFANENLFNIRYVTFMGGKWKASSVRPEYPRIIITLGGLYNGD